MDTEEWDCSKISQVGWTLLCDVFRTELCLQHEPDFIAVAVLYLAVEIVKLNVECGRARRMWWEVCASSDMCMLGGVC